jgi:hypothetical protein
MIKATKDADGNIVIVCDEITAEYIWAFAEVASLDDDNNKSTRERGRNIATALKDV